jgi:hypothetical protein
MFLASDLVVPYSQIDNISTLFDNVAAEVKSVTNFNTLVLTGGPNPLGTGGMQLFQ